MPARERWFWFALVVCLPWLAYWNGVITTEHRLLPVARCPMTYIVVNRPPSRLRHPLQRKLHDTYTCPDSTR